MEREREREENVFLFIYLSVCLSVCSGVISASLCAWEEREREREKFSLLLKLEFEREWINLLGLRSAASAQQRRLNEGMGRVRVAEPFDSLSRRFCNP